jgi:hypothetical protein
LNDNNWNLKKNDNSYTFRYNGYIYIQLDKEIYKPIAFEIELPKDMKWFEIEDTNIFRFYYKKKQFILVKTILQDKEKSITDTTYIPTKEKILDLICSKTEKFSKHYKKIEKIVNKNKYKGALLRIINGNEILLLNINDEDLHDFYSKIQTFTILQTDEIREQWLKNMSNKK